MESIYDSYILAYRKLFPSGDLLSKDYTSTIIRNIIVFFLYKHYKDKSVDFAFICCKFNIKQVKSVYQKVHSVEKYLYNRRLLGTKKDIFMNFFFIFFKVYINNKKF